LDTNAAFFIRALGNLNAYPIKMRLAGDLINKATQPQKWLLLKCT
jgi:hypothetical protein